MKNINIFFEKKPLKMICLGFSSGLPILLVFSTLSVWLVKAGISRSTVTLFSWAGFAYAFKYLWSPLVDNYKLPIFKKFGHRRSWLLFSQFLIIMAFNKHKNMLKGISNVVEATSKEEQIHGDFGIDLINILRTENPKWFDQEYEKRIQNMCKKAFEAESAIIDWIFEDGELDFLPKSQINEFIKDRFNKSLESIGVKQVFETNETELNETEWFNDEIIGTKHGDFFVKRSINYSKRTQSITGEDIF